MSLVETLRRSDRTYSTGLRNTICKGTVLYRRGYIVVSNWLSAPNRYHVTVKLDAWPFQYLSDSPCTSIEHGLELAESELERLLTRPIFPQDRVK